MTCEHSYLLLEKLSTREKGYRRWYQIYLFFCTKCLELKEIEREVL